MKKIHYNKKREVQRLPQGWPEQRVLFCYNNISAGHTSLLQVHRCYWICGRKLENVQHTRSHCTFHKHANSKVQNLPSQLRFWLPSIIITITINKPWNTETHKTDQNPPITNHKPWPFESVKEKFCFLRGPLRWMTAAKNANVSWLLNFRIHMFFIVSLWDDPDQDQRSKIT